MEDRTFVVEQHGRVVDQGRLGPLQAKRFTEAATGVQEVSRTTINLDSFVSGATA